MEDLPPSSFEYLEVLELAMFEVSLKNLDRIPVAYLANFPDR